MLLAAFAASAQAPEATFRIAGFLTNAVTGEPVRSATVGVQFLSGPRPGLASQTATADAGGHFEFALAAGTYRIWAARRGFDRQYLGPAAGLMVGEDQTGLVFKMEPFSALTGKVVDENNDPIQGAEIQLIRSEIQSGRRELRPGLSAVTDDRGEYRIASLGKGRYFVSAYARAQEAAETTAYARRFFPGSPDLHSATPLDLEPGGNGRADFRLTPEPVFHLRGKVIGGARLSDASVVLAPQDAAERFGAVAYPVRYGGESRFEISGVSAGQYTLEASAYEGVNLVRASQAIAVGAADLDGVTIMPQPGAPLTGHVTVEQSGALAALALDRVSISLHPEDSIALPAIALSVKADRSLSAAAALPGNYYVNVNVPGPYYLRSATVGGLDALAGPVTVSASGGVPPLEIVVGSIGGEVSGTVQLQGQPAAKCLVMLLRNGGATASQDHMAQSDEKGKFTIQGIAPGDYTAYAWRDIEGIEYRNPQALAQYSGTAVKVKEGSKASAELKLNVN